ncbi:hypothetical protein PFISCL1PPCAC_11482, partial [Pristionchus fissidentatus]
LCYIGRWQKARLVEGLSLAVLIVSLLHLSVRLAPAMLRVSNVSSRIDETIGSEHLESSHLLRIHAHAPLEIHSGLAPLRRAAVQSVI